MCADRFDVLSQENREVEHRGAMKQVPLWFSSENVLRIKQVRVAVDIHDDIGTHPDRFPYKVQVTAHVDAVLRVLRAEDIPFAVLGRLHNVGIEAVVVPKIADVLGLRVLEKESLECALEIAGHEVRVPIDRPPRQV